MRQTRSAAILLVAAVLLLSCSGERARTPETDALIRAARAGNADSVRTLLTSPNVDINGADEQGNTALIEAARFGHDEVVTSLLLQRADASVKNHQGKSALMLAAEGGHDQTVRTLSQAGK